MHSRKVDARVACGVRIFRSAKCRRFIATGRKPSGLIRPSFALRASEGTLGNASARTRYPRWRRRTPVKPAPVLLLRGDGYSVRQSVVLSTGLPQRAALLTSWGNPHSAGACTCAHAARTEFFDVCGHSVTSYVGRQPLAESAPSALPFLSAVLNSVAETFVRPGRSALPVALLGRFQNSVRKPAETSHLSSSIVKCSIYSGFRLFILIQKECRGAVTKPISR